MANVSFVGQFTGFTTFLGSLFILAHQSYGSKDETVKLIFGGDVTFSGIIEYHVKTGNCTYNESLSKIRQVFKEADHVIVNLENAFADLRFPQKLRDKDKIVHMISDISAAPTLKYSYIDIVSLANNHMLDFGLSPLNRTIRLLDELNINQIGVSFGQKKFKTQVPLILNEKGIKIGFLSYCAVEEGCVDDDQRVGLEVGPAVFNEKLFKEEVKELRKKVRTIILFMHMGVEYTSMPDTSQDSLMKILYSYVDVIISSHPHVTQKHFYHKNTLIVPSLGNLLFPPRPTPHKKFNYNMGNNKHYLDGSWYKAVNSLPNPTQRGRLVKLEISKSGLVRSKAQYLNTKLTVNTRHCLIAEKDGDWTDLCGKNDKQCLGTDDCNQLQCKGIHSVDKKKKLSKLKSKRKRDDKKFAEF